MTVLEVNKRIEELTRMRKDIIKLQEFFLGHIEIKDICGQVMPTEKDVTYLLEEGCNLSIPIRSLMSETAKTMGDEADRLMALVNKTEVPGARLIR